MAIDDRILTYLRAHPSGADDGELTTALGLKRRAQATALCKALVERGLLTREHIHGKVKNLLAVPTEGEEPALVAPTPPGGRWDRPWTWEGNVRVVAQMHLATLGFAVDAAATPTPDGAPDLIATQAEGGTLRVAVRGYPPETSKSKSGQARQYFANAMLDAAAWKGEHPADSVAIALPDVITYRSLVALAAWFVQASGAVIYWVRADGGVGETRLG